MFSHLHPTSNNPHPIPFVVKIEPKGFNKPTNEVIDDNIKQLTTISLQSKEIKDLNILLEKQRKKLSQQNLKVVSQKRKLQKQANEIVCLKFKNAKQVKVQHNLINVIQKYTNEIKFLNSKLKRNKCCSNNKVNK